MAGVLNPKGFKTGRHPAILLSFFLILPSAFCLLPSAFPPQADKCLVILGLSYQIWFDKVVHNSHNFDLLTINHRDVEVLELIILPNFNGEIIYNIINNLAQRVGQPLQIISDRGPDIKKGIDLYLHDRTETIYTYDFTHQIALWLKHKLLKDSRWTEFLDFFSLTRSQIQQTRLSFLLPPKLRTKARYHNIDLIINWAKNILNYWDKQDFSLISSCFIIDWNSLHNLRHIISYQSFLQLIKNLGFQTNDLLLFEEHLDKIIITSRDITHIINACNLGRRQFLDRFEWLFDYQDLIEEIDNILQVFFKAKTLLEVRGLNYFSLDDWNNSSAQFFYHNDIPPETLSAIDLVNSYLQYYIAPIPEGKFFLATSDIIESLFSKYKSFRRNAPFSEINEMILSLVLSTTQITTDLISSAMENITNQDVIDWIKSNFFPSILSKRKQAFSTI